VNIPVLQYLYCIIAGIDFGFLNLKLTVTEQVKKIEG